MPKRTDIKTILLIGSGPIVIGQGCEFDYSGTQACKALKAEGYRVVLVNSNPATIMTDPGLSDRTYIEPITPEAIAKIIKKQKEMGDPIHAVLPTLGGQTALNCGCKLFDDGVLKEYGIEMIGADRKVIHRAEDRQIFKDICESLGLKCPLQKTVTTLTDAEEFLKQIGLPAIVRPAFTLGGSGGGIAYNKEEFVDIVTRGLRASMIGQVLLDQSVIGWKEYELEVVRDKKDNCVIVCGIENIDAMGVHTGDSITVAPIQTLSDKEYQAMRDAAFAIMRAVGVETGGSNVQFAVNPNPKPGADGRKPFEMVVVEMNPRVSRSSALASKATGFPIAKIAAKLAVGYTLDELRNDVTGTTSACFEPSIDYVVTKIPRWTFEKFPEADETLTTQMKSVGEGMAIGRTFAESLQKAIRSMEVKRFGLGLDRNDKWLTAIRALGAQQVAVNPWDAEGDTALPVSAVEGRAANPDADSDAAPMPEIRTADGEIVEWPIPDDKLQRKLSIPSQGRLYYVRYALKLGYTRQQICALTHYDPWFVDQIAAIVEFEDVLLECGELTNLSKETMLRAKQLGYSDAQLANLYLGNINPDTILQVRAHRKALGVEPVYKLVDTCAAEFEAATPYYYSTYERPYRVVGGPEGAESHEGTKKAQRHDGGAPASGSSSVPSSLRASVPSVTDDEIRLSDRKKVIILGGGPNRIGQGIEFDYCCCHAAFAAKEEGFESVMVNSNPETVSTDYDTSDLLFFEPLTLEDALNIIERLNRAPLAKLPQGGNGARTGFVHGVIVQFGGQTPLNLASGLVKAGVPLIGTSLDSIDLAEDRNRFDALLVKLGLEKPPSGIARTVEQAVAIAARIGYPVLVRPSYVLGGRGMEICSDERALTGYMGSASIISDLDDAPVLIDRFLNDAIEVDVDVLADFTPTYERTGGADGTGGADVPSAVKSPTSRRSVICGVMEHIEQAGVHSGDSSCTIPPWSLSRAMVDRIKKIGHDLARALCVNGLMNVQLAIKDDRVFILEVNPRASRTVPFVGKAMHTPYPRLAAKVMMGRTLDSLGVQEAAETGAHAVKVSVFPFAKFPGVDVVLGPEMRSTGEVMGIDREHALAFAKGQMAGGLVLPTAGNVYISVRETDREHALVMGRELAEMGFNLFSSSGTGAYLAERGVRTTILPKIDAGVRPNVIDEMANGHIHLIINTPTKAGWKTDEGKIRSSAVRLGIPMITTHTGALAAVRAIKALRKGDWTVSALQDYASAAKAHAAGRPLAGAPA
ncbi:MAG: carbamoyl-phosphate synthase large subunit [Phycisphaerales bacterium]